MQPVKIIDPHLVSSFFDNYKRAYLQSTLELVNKSNFIAECSLNIQVGIDLDGDICVVEHLHSEHLYIPAGSHVVHTLPEVGFLSSLFNHVCHEHFVLLFWWFKLFHVCHLYV